MLSENIQSVLKAWALALPPTQYPTPFLVRHYWRSFFWKKIGRTRAYPLPSACLANSSTIFCIFKLYRITLGCSEPNSCSNSKSFSLAIMNSSFCFKYVLVHLILYYLPGIWCSTLQPWGIASVNKKFEMFLKVIVLVTSYYIYLILLSVVFLHHI